jgi:hypothetical protein
MTLSERSLTFVVLWNKCAHPGDPLGSTQEDLPPPQEESPKASSLGALFFEGVPQVEPGVLAVRTSADAVNPKTHFKWVWALIDTIANLVDVVVSICCSQYEEGVDCVHCSEDNRTIHL